MPLERQELIVNCRARQPTARVAFLSRLFRNRLPATDPSLAVGYSGRRSFPSRCSNGVGTQTYAPREQFKKFAVGNRSLSIGRTDRRWDEAAVRSLSQNGRAAWRGRWVEISE